MTFVKKLEYKRKDAIEERVLEQERRKILCPECRTEKKKLQWNWRVVVCPIEEKAQQSGIQTEVPRNAAKEEDK